ncbi:fatty acid/sphingolipid desaturase [Metschnikowia bicuspidata var. bicuspidata NRRL YB-4993]|uniref:Delta 8-(E)-sphingolipid desaturase n=1 Tax=Metschnikowia bicuspidata var. bicuspidata NRRL YB-4993 TaxID=869754 RepID=A0A1A0HJH7_9ASCO|nr:fatty acid/sphingolipid desaturase [Metschnikowia bicuspidata var. bicuspidata NRRL YB-4993]OBA24314.1 fatty acid/sphingolipid desaturase [Metschnikowia bicuspidata var. bicuspidata NRRL YB-4993]
MVKKFTSRQIEGLISEGKVIVIYENSVLNLTSWLKYHPGGDKAVYHMVGRDATDEMLAYHSEESIATFSKWKIGEIDTMWKNLLPPIQGAVYPSNTKRAKTSDSLGEKLDSGSPITSDDASSETSVELEDLEVNPKLHQAGSPLGPVKPVVPQNIEYVNSSNKEQLYPITGTGAIVDPKELMRQFDNGLVREELLRLPDLDYGTQNQIREKYEKLHATVIKNGFYKCHYSNYVREVVKIASLFLYSFSFLHLGYYFLSALFMGTAWHQMTFIAHDAGHVSISHNYQIDNLFGMIIADWFGGLSLGWWKRNHNVHHLITNDPVHDPDIQHLPFFAVSTRLFGDVYSTYYDKVLWLDAFAKKVIPFQEYLYYPILTFGRFNLYRLSWTHLLLGQGPRHGKAAWFSVEGGWNKFMFVMISHMATMLVHVQITLSHFAMSTADLGVSESFASRQLRTTMDVDCPGWLDFLHGGLQFQAIHHLFPRLPRHNLRRVQPFVIEFCEDVGLPYSIYGFGKGNEVVIGKLSEIGKQCSIMLECTRKMKDDQHPFT